MSRLYLTILLLQISCAVNSQNQLKKYLEFAHEQFEKGDYYHASIYYEKAMQLDSNTVDILWNYAETMRAYKDYRKAEYYYSKVYKKEEAGIYPKSILYLGLMQKQNGKYDEAINTFKLATKKYSKNKKDYNYKKSKQELGSCLWAKSALKDTSDYILNHLPPEVNSKNSEFGHTIYDNQLLFSSLRADSISETEEVYAVDYKTQLYSSKLEEDNFHQGIKIKTLNIPELSSGNGSYSLDGKRFYFSRCNEKGYNYTCNIMVASYNNGTWNNVDVLGEIINAPGANTTMPQIGEMNGKEVLFFTSDREKTKGGLDIWMSIISNGNQYSKPKPITEINTPDNELSPFWDKETQQLYFSSSWHNGFGGYDIFASKWSDETFSEAQNIGLPLNSPANDLYYFEHGDTVYFTSNRLGVFYSKNPTCCSDIFSAHLPKITVPPTKEETLAELSKRLPVTLYFHNDIPDPRSRDTLTRVNYIDAYNDYTAMIEIYQNEYAKGLAGTKAQDAREDIDNFFIEYVDQGVKDLFLFRDLLLKELQNGAKINITVKGFASPLAKTDYNVNLTKRRISSLINYLRAYDNGVFVPYLDNTAVNGGRVIFSQVPFGEYIANQLTSDNPHDTQNSVYSRAAAIERKIEIQSVSYIQYDAEFPFKSSSLVFDGGIVKEGTLIEAVFKLKNISPDTIYFGELKLPCDCLESDFKKASIAPEEEIEIRILFDTKNILGHTSRSAELTLNGFSESLKLIITTEVKAKNTTD